LGDTPQLARTRVLSDAILVNMSASEALGRLYEAEVVERGGAADGFVFTGRNGVGPMGDDSPLEMMQKVQQRAGLVVKRDGKLRPLAPSTS
jgi:hypothetical protein